MDIKETIALAVKCKVTMHAACRRSGVSYSTTYRWKKGAKPSQETLEKITAAIIICADEAGTLPEQYREHAEQIKKTPMAERKPADIMREMKSNMKELEKAISA